MNPNQLRQMQKGKITSIEVIVEDGKSYQVTKFESSIPGQASEEKILVTKEFYQKRIDVLQAQVDKLTELRDACAE